MWLPKDERRLLAGYYTLISEISTKHVYRLSELASLLQFRGHRARVPEYGESESPTTNSDDLETVKRKIAEYSDSSNRINKANSLLAARGLVTVTPHQHETSVVIIGLSVEGYDLGRRFSNTFESSGLWFQEYRNHWIWLIVAFLGGAVGAKLLDGVASLFADG